MSLVLVFDCGATNLRAIAINPMGEVVASHYIKNSTVQDDANPDYHFWDFHQIWSKLVECALSVILEVGENNIVAITVTTFGVDGAPFDSDGNQIYPIISWKCPRTLPVMKSVSNELDRIELYSKNGIGDYNFNTLYKLKWLKENEPSVYSNMDRFVFISSMITHQLTGIFTTDYTMAGTSMMTDLDECDWNDHILDYLSLDRSNFAPMIMAGEQIGQLSEQAMELLGLTSSIPVVSAGHDTQFALVGSGAEKDKAFLSSGTWEILMARSQRPRLDEEALSHGVTVELDSINGIYNPAIQWLSSAIIEWIGEQFYSVEKENGTLYEVMVKEAADAGIDAGGVVFDPNFAVTASGIGQGAIKSLSIYTTRGQITRAVFEGLSNQLKKKLDYLSKLCNLQPGPIVVVGGGTKNALWNQLRANALMRPLHIVEQAEATVIGAAMFGFVGAGHYPNIDIAQANMKPKFRIVNPNQ